nr:dethiobiotin synthase [Pseudomonas sp.]
MKTFSCFVTGTDTGVGKSLVSSALLLQLTGQGRRCVGMKPVAAGTVLDQGQWMNEDVLQLQAASNVEAPLALRCPYLLHAPLSPHLAAKADDCEISLDHLVSSYAQLSRLADTVVVEGAGGFRVPLTEDLDGADLAEALGLPVVLVVGVRLGCLNHALLSQDAILARGLPLAGWVACRIDPDMAEPEANVESPSIGAWMRRRSDIPWLEHADAIAAARFLDISTLAR